MGPVGVTDRTGREHSLRYVLIVDTLDWTVHCIASQLAALTRAPTQTSVYCLCATTTGVYDHDSGVRKNVCITHWLDGPYHESIHVQSQFWTHERKYEEKTDFVSYQSGLYASILTGCTWKQLALRSLACLKMIVWHICFFHLRSSVWWACVQFIY